jgi:hypothetical protein
LNSAQALLSLQAIDQELASRRRAHRKTLKELESQGGLPDLKDRTEKAHARELEARVEHARLEAELATLKDRVNHLEERLYSGAITNVKELQAVEAEHAAARRQYVVVEQSIGPALASAQEAKNRYEELQMKLAEAEEAWKSAEQKLGAERESLEHECQDIGKKRAREAGGIPAQDLSFYESLLARKSGVAVVRVERGICQGCRVRLPLREISRIRGASALVACSSCGRILLGE